MSVDTGDARISVDIPSDVKRRLRVEAAKNDQSMARLVREILHDWAHEEDLEYEPQAD